MSRKKEWKRRRKFEFVHENEKNHICNFRTKLLGKKSFVVHWKKTFSNDKTIQRRESNFLEKSFRQKIWKSFDKIQELFKIKICNHNFIIHKIGFRWSKTGVLTTITFSFLSKRSLLKTIKRRFPNMTNLLWIFFFLTILLSLDLKSDLLLI